jgi:hypothetical protein
MQKGFARHDDKPLTEKELREIRKNLSKLSLPRWPTSSVTLLTRMFPFQADSDNVVPKSACGRFHQSGTVKRVCRHQSRIVGIRTM